MKTRRKSIQLFEHERALLVELYSNYRIPVDSFDGFPVERAAFVQEWRTLSNRSDTAQELVHYMRVQRKTGRWVQLGDDYRRSPPLPKLTADQTEVLVSIYYEKVTVLENGSDTLSYDDDVAALVAKEFHAETGLYIEPHLLVMKLTALRKRGLLPKVADLPKTKVDTGFDDIEDVVV